MEQWKETMHFNPRPLRRATKRGFDGLFCCLISIHALYGGRRQTIRPKHAIMKFQSTPSTEGDHNLFLSTQYPCLISIHALYGGRQKTFRFQSFFRNFNPRPLRRATLGNFAFMPQNNDFNPRPLRRAT